MADLAAHIATRFRLRRSCSRCVILSMDGFTLPPFESTCIFRNNDIVRVKQKISKKIAQHNDGHCIEDPEVVEKQPLRIDDEMLTIEYEKDDDSNQQDVQYNHQNGDNTTSHFNTQNGNKILKRKCQDGERETPGTSRKKKLKVTNTGKHTGCSNEDKAHQDQDRCGSKKLKSPSTDDANKVMQAEATVTLEKEQKPERDNQSKLNNETKEAECNTQGDTKKVSRSARRKKFKRQLRQKAKEQLKEKVQCQEQQIVADCPSSNKRDVSLSPSRNQNNSSLPFVRQEADEEESDTSDDIVPVVVRPGHIRFESPGTGPDKSPVKEVQTTFQWSGTTSKKKGQKWGMNNSNKKNSDANYHGRITGTETEVNFHAAVNKTNDNDFGVTNNQKVGESSHAGSASEKTVAEKGKSSSEPLDFESLYPLTRLPKEGDLIVYRLVELSSTWCPELSSYRVGKVLIYDHISLRIILLPVTEYPFTAGEKIGEDKSEMLEDMSPYNEDGSLEIEYASLLDVRLLKDTDSVQSAVTTPLKETSTKGGSLVQKPANNVDNSKGKIHSQNLPNYSKDPEAIQEKTRKTIWEENGEASNDEPAVQENGWGAWTPNASTSAWSYRALRSSAIGPTVAFLRGNNTKRGRPYNRKYGK
uniref:Coilin n=2 Tax=Oryza brachyantha TaxID=4533 RepID=J3NCQ7_ORYBR